MITYRHIKHIFRVSEQKGIWILSYSNLAGALAGLMAANLVHGWLPLVPGVLWYPLGILAGVVITFRVAGWPLYTQLYRWGRYTLLHQLTPRAFDLDTTLYYPAAGPETTTLLVPRPRPVTVSASTALELLPTQVSPLVGAGKDRP
jgi:hypothetical protein